MQSADRTERVRAVNRLRAWAAAEYVDAEQFELLYALEALGRHRQQLAEAQARFEADPAALARAQERA